MILTINPVKIINRKYKDKMIVYSYDDGNKIVLPKRSNYTVCYKNKRGALPIVDSFTGDTYLINKAVYSYFGLNTIEFIETTNGNETILLVDFEVNVSVKNMSDSGLKKHYLYSIDKDIRELETITKEISQQAKETNKNMNELDGNLIKVNQKIEAVNVSTDSFMADVADKSQLVDDKYQQFDDNVTTAGQTIDDILALQPQFQSVLDETEENKRDLVNHKLNYIEYIESELGEEHIIRSLPNGTKDEIRVSGNETELVKRIQNHIIKESDIIRYLDNYTSVGLVRILKTTLAGWNQIGKDSASGGVDVAHLIENYPAKNTPGTNFDDPANINTSTVKIGVDFLDIIVAKGRFANLAEAQNYFNGTELTYQLAEPILIPLPEQMTPNTIEIARLSELTNKLTNAIISLGGTIA